VEVSCQVHALTPGKEPPVPIWWGLGGPRSLSGRGAKEKNPYLYRESNLGRPAHRSVTIIIFRRGLVGDRLNSLVLQGSCDPSSYLEILFLHESPLYDLSAHCSRAGCPASSIPTVPPLQAGTTRAVGAGNTIQWHKLYSGTQTWYL
jgi:hypothetical protein